MSNRSPNGGDVTLLLMLVPFIASAADALYLWAGVGFSLVLPQVVFTSVTGNQYVFLLGLLGVLGAMFFEVSKAEPSRRAEAVQGLSTDLQRMAVLTFVLAFIMAWYSTGFLDPGTAVFDLLIGRYAIIFPGILMLASFLILPAITLPKGQWKGLVAVLVLLCVPAALYEVGKRNTVVGLALALVLLVAGAWLVMISQPQQKKTVPARQPAK